MQIDKKNNKKNDSIEISFQIYVILINFRSRRYWGLGRYERKGLLHGNRIFCPSAFCGTDFYPLQILFPK